MSRNFYRFEGLDLLPGNKKAGFYFIVDTQVLRDLCHVKVHAADQQLLTTHAQERAARVQLLNKRGRASMNILFHQDTAAPRAFCVDPMFGGSIGADPEDFARLSRPDFLDYIGEEVVYTPHNVDLPQQALVLLLMAQTWAEWAALQRAKHADALAQLPPSLEPMPTFGSRFTLQEFQEMEASHAIIPDDGSGYYATENGLSRVDCFGPAPGWATHVMWFNR